MFTNTPNLGMPLPTVSNELGPQYATDVNNCISILDSHNHGPGSGVPIGTQGLNIQSDLGFNINNATSLRTVRFVATTASSGTDIGCVYVKGADLFYNDISGNVVRITQNGGLSSTAQFIGNISTTAITSAAGPTPATSGFIRMNNNTDFVSWRNAANTGDDRIYFDSSDVLQVVGSGISAAPYKLLDTSTNKSVSLQATAGTSAYTASMPAQPTSASGPLFLTTTGAITANGQVGSGNLAPNVNLPGLAVLQNNKVTVVGSTSGMNSLSLIRGIVNGSGVIVSGEGFTVNKTGTGQYAINYTSLFLDAAVPVAIPLDDGSHNATMTALTGTLSSSGVTLVSRVDTAVADNQFQFIVVGQRAS